MSVTTHNSNKRDQSVKDFWLDKLWAGLFDGNAAGLMSPGQIRREHRDRYQVRQLEMEAIFQAESEINEIHLGTKALDDRGNVIDTPSVEPIATHRIIENTAIEQGYDVGMETSASMLRSVVKEISVRELERSLNYRKIAILAESEVLAAQPRVVSREPVNAEWMVRWRESAENVFHAELQVLWAKMLVDEIAAPGTYSLGSLGALKQLNHDDLQVLQLIGKYAFPTFIYNAAQYFKHDHNSWFEVMEDLGLMNYSATSLDLKALPGTDGALVLPCGNKALRVTGLDSLARAEIPTFKLTRIGKQLFPLAVNEADLAYLFDLGRRLKALGCTVEIGEWQTTGGNSRGRFDSKISL